MTRTTNPAYKAKNPPPVFCVSGIDGVGKTTLFQQLSQKLSKNGFYFVSRGPSDGEDAVEKYFPRPTGMLADWTDGTFNKAMAMACGLDYAAYFDRIIAPLLTSNVSTNTVFGRTLKGIITDRHATCFKAFAHTSPEPCQQTLTLLNALPEPDVIFHIEVSNATIAARNDTHSKVLHDFEKSECQQRLSQGYERTFESYPGTLYRISNDGPLEDTLQQLTALIDEHSR